MHMVLGSTANPCYIIYLRFRSFADSVIKVNTISLAIQLARFSKYLFILESKTPVFFKLMSIFGIFSMLILHPRSRGTMLMFGSDSIDMFRSPTSPWNSPHHNFSPADYIPFTHDYVE